MKYIYGDITQNTRGVLLNGVNCQYAMGAGVALAYLRKWPIVREQYVKTKSELGKLDTVEIENGKLYVANCYRQEFFGGDGAEYASYDAIRESVSKAVVFAKELGLTVKTPLIGAGLGGLEEDKVIALLEEIEQEFDIEIEMFILK